MADEASTRKTKKRKPTAHQAAIVDDQKPSKKPKLVGTGPKCKGAGLKLSFHGVLYQLHLLILFLKRGVDQGYSFILGSEVEAAEKFDDVVFRYEDAGKYKLRFLQAKHKIDNTLKIKRKDLVKKISITEKNDNHDFSIQKYFIFYQKFKQRKEKETYLKGEIQNFTFCTNIDIEESLEDSFDSIEIHYNDPLMVSEGETQSRTLKLKQETSLYNELIKILASTYKSLAKELGALIANKSSLTYRKSILEYQHWIMQNIFDPNSLEQIGRKYYLKLRKELCTRRNNSSVGFFEAFTNKDSVYLYKEKVQIFPKFAEVIKNNKTRDTDNESESQLKEDILFFLDNLVFAVRQPSENQLKNIIEDEFASSMDMPDGELATSIVRTRLQDWFKEKDGRFLTNIDCRNLFENLQNTFAFLCQIGITLIAKNRILKKGNVKNYIFKDNCNTVKKIKDFINNEDIKKKVLLVCYNDRLLTQIKLLQILSLNEIDKCKNFMFTDIEDYINVLNTVACPIKALKSETCNRMFIMQNKVNECTKKLLKNVFEIFKLKKGKQIVIIMPLNRYDEFMIKTCDPQIEFEYLEDSENSFEDLSEKTQSYLRKTAKFVFQGYTVTIDELLSYDDTISQSLKDYSLSRLVRGSFKIDFNIQNDKNYHDIKNSYVERRLLNSDKPNEKEHIVASLNDINDIFVFITGEPGSGKSSLLSHVALKTKELQLNNPEAKNNMCIIKTYLYDYVTLLFDQEKNRDEITNITAVNFLYVLSGLRTLDKTNENEIIFKLNADGCLAARTEPPEQTPLHLRLFEYLYNHKKIVLLLDALDEIAPHYADRVLDYLVKFKEMGIHKIWLTTRPFDIENKLKRKVRGSKRNAKSYKSVLNASPYTLMPLTEPEQKKILNFICKKERFHIDFKELQRFCKDMQLIGHNMVEELEAFDLLSTPQQLNMLATIYNEEKKKVNIGSKKLTSYDLYQKCVDILFKKSLAEIKYQDPRLRKEYANKHRSFISNHENLALMELFPTYNELIARSTLNSLRAKVKKGEEKTGLVVSAAGGKLRFVHRTYAEYFAARRLADEVYPDNKKKKKISEVKDLLYKIMCNGAISDLFIAFFNHRIIDRMLDEKQKKKSNKNTGAVLTDNDADLFKAAINGDKDILDDIKCKNLRDALGRTPIHLLMSSCFLGKAKLFYRKYVIDLCIDLIKDSLFDWTVIHYYMVFRNTCNNRNNYDPYTFLYNNLSNLDLSHSKYNPKDWKGQTALTLFYNNL